MKKLLLLGVAFGVAASFGQRAVAATSDSSFDVTASVSDSCTIAAPNMAFGAYDVVNGATATTLVTVTCTGIADGTDVNYSVDGGLNYGANSNLNRVMYGAAETGYLAYTISASSGGPDIGNTGINGTTTVTGGTGTQTLYGYIAPQSHAPAGTDYTDTVGLIVTY